MNLFMLMLFDHILSMQTMSMDAFNLLIRLNKQILLGDGCRDRIFDYPSHSKRRNYFKNGTRRNGKLMR